MNISITTKIKELRETKGWTQTRLAKESGVSQTYISELEAGKSVPTIPIVYKLAVALGVKPSDLLDYKFKTQAETKAG